MNVTVSCTDLARALDLARSLTPTNPVVLAHGYVQLTAAEGRLRVIATDGDTTVHASLAANITDEGSVTVAPRSLLPLLQGRKADQVRLSVESGNLLVSGLTRRPYRFTPFLGALAAPAAPQAGDTALNLSALPTAVAAVRHACARDTGIAQISASNGTLTLATTDSYRLAVARIQAPVADFSEVVSLAALDTVTKRPVHWMAPLTQSRLLAFTGEDIAWTTRPLGLAFPRLDAVVDARPDTGVNVDPVSALAHLQRLSSVDPSGEHPVHITVDEDMLSCVVTTPTGSGSEDVPVTGAGLSGFDVHVRRSYFVDSLAAHGRADVRLTHAGGLQPIFLTSTHAGLELLTVVMPVRP